MQFSISSPVECRGEISASSHYHIPPPASSNVLIFVMENSRDSRQLPSSRSFDDTNNVTSNFLQD